MCEPSFLYVILLFGFYVHCCEGIRRNDSGLSEWVLDSRCPMSVWFYYFRIEINTEAFSVVGEVYTSIHFNYLAKTCTVAMKLLV